MAVRQHAGLPRPGGLRHLPPLQSVVQGRPDCGSDAAGDRQTAGHAARRRGTGAHQDAVARVAPEGTAELTQPCQGAGAVCRRGRQSGADQPGARCHAQRNRGANSGRREEISDAGETGGTGDPARAATGNREGGAVMIARTLVLFLGAALGLAAQAVDRTKPPQTPPIPTYKLPPVEQSRLPNGLGVVLVEDSRFPLITLRLNFQAGSKFDPKDMPGLAEAVASLLTEGTKTRDSRQLSEETDGIGGSIDGSAGPDSLTIAGSALSENLSKLMALLADVTLNASLPHDEIHLYKQNRIQNLRAEHAEPGFLAEEKMASVVYGTSPYAHIAPTEASVQKVDAKILAGFRDTYLIPNNATLLIIGKLPARDEVLKI